MALSSVTPTTKTVLDPGAGPLAKSNAGLMGVGAANPGQPVNPVGYKPQLLGQDGTYTQHANAFGYDATTGTASTYDPTMIDRTGTTYDPTTQTVQQNQLTSQQLNDLIAGNSKYIQQARQQGLESAAARGLMTSSIAAGNATNAAINAALPIAQGDAARYGSVADQNMGAQNTASQYNAGNTLSLNTNNAQFANQAAATNAAAKQQMEIENMQAANAAAAAKAAAQNAASQFNAASFNAQSAANQAAINQANEFNATSQNSAQQVNASLPIQREAQMTQVLSDIYSNPNLTAAQQQQAAANAKTVLQGLQQATNATFAAGVPQIFK